MATHRNLTLVRHTKEKRAGSYDTFKEYKGQRYTGMKIGRSHKWNYDPGVWTETKLTPDEWKIHYAVHKRRAGKAPEGSGAPVGTAYHWYVLADQTVTKLDANTYSTELAGTKFKLAHKRSDKSTWSASEAAQKRHLIKILKELIAQLETKPAEAKSRSVPAKKKGAAPRRKKSAHRHAA